MVPPDKKLKLFVVIIQQPLELTLTSGKLSFAFGREFARKIKKERSN